MRYQIWTFLRLVWSEWASRVTGSLSAILVLFSAGIYVASIVGVAIPAQSILQMATWALVAICVGQATYAVWARERMAREHAEVELALFRDGSSSMDMPSAAMATVSPDVSAFRAYREQKARQFWGVEARADALQLSLGTTAEFEHIQAVGNHVIRTVLFCVENKDRSHYISNCNVLVHYNNLNTSLLEGFTLNPSEKKFIRLAGYSELPGNPDIWICGQRPGGFFAEAYNYLRLPCSGTIITLEANSRETQSTKLVCRLFVDTEGKLKLEKI